LPSVAVTVGSPIVRSFRVEAIAGLFGLQLADRPSETFSAEIPSLDESWTIGAIVGPSGSGKSTIARAGFPGAVYRRRPWPRDRAVVEGFPERPVKQITETLTAVGFSSPPSWVKAFAVLSNGEQFRCELARALLSSASLVVFNEFTSVVDRTVAQIGSAAVAKSVRLGRVPVQRFVAVSCHYDVLDWLEPDWVLDMATCQLVRGRLPRRPPISLSLFRCEHSAWRLFAKHHYLTGDLHKGAHCYLALWRDRPVAFCATMPSLAKARRRRISRLVTLPDYQGVGIGGAVLDAVADLYAAQGIRMNITTSHPAMIHRLGASPRWRLDLVLKRGCTKCGIKDLPFDRTSSRGRAVVGFEYRPLSQSVARRAGATPEPSSGGG